MARLQEAEMLTASRPGTDRWVLKAESFACSLPHSPTISHTGELAFDVDVSFALDFHSWLSSWVQGHGRPLSGELIVYDYRLQEKTRYAFTSAYLRGLTFPELDGALNVAGRLTLNLQATGFAPLAPEKNSGMALNLEAKQKQWLCRNFKVSIGNLDTTKVSHVDSIKLTTPGAIPNVGILVPQHDVQQFVDWRVQGTPLPATIQFLSPMLQPFFSLSFTALAGAIAPVAATGMRSMDLITRVPVSLIATAATLSAG